MPRVILDSLFRKNKNEQMLGSVHYALFANCFYSDGYVDVNGQQVLRQKGQFLRTYGHLASLVYLSTCTTCNLVKELVAKSLVEVHHMADGSMQFYRESIAEVLAYENMLPATIPVSVSDVELDLQYRLHTKASHDEEIRPSELIYYLFLCYLELRLTDRIRSVSRHISLNRKKVMSNILPGCNSCNTTGGIYSG